MRRFLFLFCILLQGAVLSAQSPEAVADSVRVAQLDSLLMLQGMYGSLPSGVVVRESEAVSEGFLSLVRENAETENFTGFRIKLYQSSAQSALLESERLEADFSEWYPAIPVYRNFSSPYFRVTVGDFRTRVDAERVLRILRSSFPTATIVKEKMKYPYLD